MIRSDSLRPHRARTFMGSAVACGGLIDGASSPARRKGDLRSPWRPTTGGAARSGTMSDDKKVEPRPSGLVVVGSRGVPEGDRDHRGNAAHLLHSGNPDQIPDADQHVRAFRQAMASRAAFDRAYWSLDRTLSWITYRDYFHMDTPYLRGTMYPTMLGVPAVIEPAAASKLLQALRRSDRPILCFRDGKEIHGSEWEPVDFPSNPKRWPQSVFAREDVLRLWHEVREDDDRDQSIIPEHESVARPLLLEAAEPVQDEFYGPWPLSSMTAARRLEQLKIIGATIIGQAARWDATPINKQPGIPKLHPFRDELERLFGGPVSRDYEARPAWKSRLIAPKRGRPPGQKK